jgi:hypothetical protein
MLMGRGPGNVMKWMIVIVVEVHEAGGGRLTYETLARGIYRTAAPTPSELAAVARAARRLESKGFLQIYTWQDDRRRKVVGPSPWLLPAATLLSSGLNMGNKSWFAEIKTTIDVLRELASSGALGSSVSDPLLDFKTPKALTIDAWEVPIHLPLPSGSAGGHEALGRRDGGAAEQ